MEVRRLSPPDRGVSVVVGTVLLVSLVTLLVALLGALILGGTFYEQTPEADLVYQEERDGTVHIAVTDAQALSAGDTELRLEGGGSCGFWGGSGPLGKGDVTTVADCDGPLEKGDVIQIVGSGTLIDTYQIRSVFPDHGCERYEDELENGDPIVVENGDTVACNFVGDGGNRLPNDVRVKDDGKLIGDIKTSGVLEITNGRVHGDIDSIDGFDLKEGSKVVGDVTADEKNVYLRGGSDVDGSIVSRHDSKDISLEIGPTDSSTVSGDISSERHVIVKDENTVRGDVSAAANVMLKANAVIEGDVTDGDVTECGSGAMIDGDPCYEHENYLGS